MTEGNVVHFRGTDSDDPPPGARLVGNAPGRILARYGDALWVIFDGMMTPMTCFEEELETLQ